VAASENGYHFQGGTAKAETMKLLVEPHVKVQINNHGNKVNYQEVNQSPSGIGHFLANAGTLRNPL
jgi:hypothetical protein